MFSLTSLVSAVGGELAALGRRRSRRFTNCATAWTRLAEAGVNLALLMAKSGHQNLRSLQRHARPGTEAVATMTAAHDPTTRRR